MSLSINEITFPSIAEIKAIVFDMDGTLYISDEFASAIKLAAASYLSGVLGISADESRKMMSENGKRLAKEKNGVVTLSGVCACLGGNTRDMHKFFGENLQPENFLTSDSRVVDLLERLSKRFELYLYTNNSRKLSERILKILGIKGFFSALFTIDDDWIAKPNTEKLKWVLNEIEVSPNEALFVGDRYNVDLQIPEQNGCPVYLSQNIDELLLLDQLLDS